MKETEFKNFLESLDQAREIRAGKRQPGRIFKIKPIEIKSIRKKWHVSQTEFAHLIGISAGTLRNWEQGRAYPEGPARVLLKIAQIRPDAIREAVAA
jgi:putative transcriptional regulator